MTEGTIWKQETVYQFISHIQTPTILSHLHCSWNITANPSDLVHIKMRLCLKVLIPMSNSKCEGPSQSLRQPYPHTSSAQTIQLLWSRCILWDILALWPGAKKPSGFQRKAFFRKKESRVKFAGKRKVKNSLLKWVDCRFNLYLQPPRPIPRDPCLVPRISACWGATTCQWTNHSQKLPLRSIAVSSQRCCFDMLWRFPEYVSSWFE